MSTENESTEHELLNETLDDAEELLESRFDDALVEKEKPHYRGPNKLYSDYCSFRNLDDAVYAIKEGLILNNTWNKKDCKDTYEGVKLWYACNDRKCPCVI